MASTEHIFHRPLEVYKSVNTTGGDPSGRTEQANSQLGFPFTNAGIESEQFSTELLNPSIRDINEAGSEGWEATGYVPPLAGGDLNSSQGEEEQKNIEEVLDGPPETVGKDRNDYFRVIDLGLNRDEELSPDANRGIYRIGEKNNV